MQWEQSIAYNKRYLAAPRLVGELIGTARKYVAGKRPDWVSFPGGVQHLMQHLRRSLGKPQIPELSEHLSRFFKNSRRRKIENEEEEEPQANFTMSSLAQNGMNEEGLSLMVEAEEQAEEALALIHQAKKTLKEARAKQHQVKLSRKYYQVSTEKSQTKGKITCFRCGGDHKVAQCPDRHAPKKEQGNVTTEEAPFVCFSEIEEGMMVQGSGKLSTEEAIKQGYGIIDGGATKTLGSLHALEAIAEENLRKHKEDRVLEVNTRERPVFGFGNSSRDQCVSTAKMKIEAGPKSGVLTVHALDRGQGPVLLSIDTLRKLGAIIDFAEDLVVFRNLDDKKLIQAQQSQVGHQLLPLTENLYSNAVDSIGPIPSLRSFCKG